MRVYIAVAQALTMLLFGICAGLLMSVNSYLLATIIVLFAISINVIVAHYVYK